MLDPNWAWTPIILWVALFALLALLSIRTVLRDRREYQRFKRYRSTAKRQAMLRRWLLDSMWSIGGVSLLLLVLVWQFVGPLLAELQSWFTFSPVVVWGALIGAVVGLTVLTVLGVVSARRSPDELATVGDVAAMIPRNKQEIRLGWLLSLNAGISEELMFRLAVPALVYGASGSAVVAVVFSVLLFGVLHLYQGPVGIIGTTVIGALFFVSYVATGTILVPIVLHALFDLRSLVLIPVAVFGAHRVDGTVQKYIPRVRAGVRVEPVETPASSPASRVEPVETPASSPPQP